MSLASFDKNQSLPQQLRAVAKEVREAGPRVEAEKSAAAVRIGSALVHLTVLGRKIHAEKR